jgi:hypothetical protein
VPLGFDTVLEDSEFGMHSDLQVCEKVSVQIETFISVKDKTWGCEEYWPLPTPLLH